MFFFEMQVQNIISITLWEKKLGEHEHWPFFSSQENFAKVCHKWSFKMTTDSEEVLLMLSPSPHLVICFSKVTLFCCDGLTMPGYQVPTKAALSLPFSMWTWDKKYNKRLLSWHKGRKRSLTYYCYGQNRLKLGKTNLISHQSNQSRKWWIS